MNKIHGHAAFQWLTLVRQHAYGCTSTPAFHRIPVLACGYYSDGYYTFGDEEEPAWVHRIRNRCFKWIRVIVCRQWLERVRMEIRRAEWCDDVVAHTVIAQLEAWFAAVPHEDVRWSEYDYLFEVYRVKQWLF